MRAAGGVSVAWQAEFDRLGVPLRAGPGASGSPRSATVVHGDRRADLLLDLWERPHYLSLRDGIATSLQGFAGDLAVAARVTRVWMSGARPGAVAAAWPFLGSVALAAARERGDQRESRWLWLYENHCGDPIATRLRAFVALAFHEPGLRELYPFTSHWALCFSATTEWPFTQDQAVVVPAAVADRFRVRTPDRRLHDETDAAGALRLVLASTLGS